MHQHVSKSIIGTEASPVTLTAAFAGTVSSTVFAERFKKAAFDVSYVPVTAGANVQLLFEYSNEDKMTVTPAYWKPLSVNISGTTEIDVYAAGGTNMGSASGTPINIPAPGTSSAATAVTCHVTPDTDLVATFLRVRAQEYGASGSFGTLYVRLSLQS